jgi:hypothetical protein
MELNTVKCRVDEAGMYQKAELTEHIYSFEHVKITRDVSNTTSYFRNGLRASTYATALEQWKDELMVNASSTQGNRLLSERQIKVQEQGEDEEPFLFMQLCDWDADDDVNIFETLRSDVVPHSLTRLVMKDSGVTLKYFADLPELVKVFLDCVEGKKTAQIYDLSLTAVS